MAWNSQATIGSGQSKASTATVAMTTSAVAEAGRVVIVIVAIDNKSATDTDIAGEVASITDSAGGNTWSQALEWVNGRGSAAAGATVAVWISKLTNQIPSGGTITANLANATFAKAITATKISVAAGSTISVAGSATRSDVGVDPGLMSISGIANSEYLFVRGIAGETNSTVQITLSTGYLNTFTADQTSGGAAASNMGVRGEYRILTTNSGDSSDPTWVSADHASVFVALLETLAPSWTVGQGAGTFQPASLDEQATDDPISFILWRVIASLKRLRLAFT